MPGRAGRRERVAIEPPDADRGCPQGDRLEHVGAAIEAAIDDDRHPAFHHLDHLGKDIHRAARMIERAPAVVGHVDALDAAIERDLRVLAGLDALDDDLGLRVALGEALDRRPVEAGLRVVLVLAAVGDAVEALHHVALAPRVVREVDREAELRHKAGLLRALVDVVDELVVAAHIELENLERVRRLLGESPPAAGSVAELCIIGMPNSPAAAPPLRRRRARNSAARRRVRSVPADAYLAAVQLGEQSTLRTLRSTRGLNAIESSD